MDGVPPEIPPPSQSKVLNFMVGMLMTSSMYAVYFCLFLVTAYLIVQESGRQTSYLFYLSYILLAWLIYTMNIASLFSTDAALLLCTMKDVTPLTLCKIAAVESSTSIARLNITGATSVIISTLADLLSIWRAWILWQRKWLVIVPSLLMLALSISLFAWANALPDLAPAALTFAVSGLSGGVDLVTSGLIIGRLLFHRQSVSMLGKQHQRQYTTLIAIFVESSALTATARILNAILQFTTDGEISWSQSFSNGCSCIGPLLIILRITLKIAHDGRSPRSTNVNAIKFAPPRSGDSSAVKTVMSTVIDGPPKFSKPNRYDSSFMSNETGESTTNIHDKNSTDGSIQLVRLDRVV